MTDEKNTVKEENEISSSGQNPKAFLKKIIGAGRAFNQSPGFQKFKTNLKNFKSNFKAENWIKISICIFVAALTYTVYKTAPHWKELWKIPYISSLESVADKKFKIEANDDVIRYDNDLLLPQYIVLVNKIVVNIKPGKLSTDNPMIAFDIYVRADTEAAAVEIKQREKQIQDHLQRFCETLQYDKIQTEEGKLTWKNRMKRELNLILSTGKAKEVFFKTLLIKP